VGPEFRVNTYTTLGQTLPAVAAGSAGNFVVVWERHDGYPLTPLRVVGQRFDSSATPLGPEFLISDSNLSAEKKLPSVAADSAGNFVVVWLIEFLSGTFIGGQRYASSGTPLGEFGTTTFMGPTLPVVAADSSGNFVVVWTEPYYRSTRNIFGQRFDSSGAHLGSKFLVNTFTPGNQTAPAVAVDSTGNFVVVWSGDGSGDSYGVFAQRYASSGMPLGGEFRVNAYTSSEQRYPSAVADSSGNFVVVWESQFQDGSFSGIYAQRYASSGAPLGPEFRVNVFTSGIQRHPSVATDAAGNFVVVWDGPGLDDFAGIFGQRYAVSGEPLGPEFRANTYTTNVQAYPAVAASALGNFVVVWESNLQDGSNDGVFGQRFNMIVPVELMNFRVE